MCRECFDWSMRNVFRNSLKELISHCSNVISVTVFPSLLGQKIFNIDETIFAGKVSYFAWSRKTVRSELIIVIVYGILYSLVHSLTFK